MSNMSLHRTEEQSGKNFWLSSLLLRNALQPVTIAVIYVLVRADTIARRVTLTSTYNPGHNILALFNNLADVLIPTSKTILDI